MKGKLAFCVMITGLNLFSAVFSRQKNQVKTSPFLSPAQTQKDFLVELENGLLDLLMSMSGQAGTVSRLIRSIILIFGYCGYVAKPNQTG